MNPLLEIQIQDYRSFTKEHIAFHEATCIVGANESGKSNLLNAIYHLSSEKQDKPFEPDELRIGTQGYPQGEVKICYKIRLVKSLMGELYDQFPNLLDHSILLTKRGTPGETPSWDTVVEIPRSSIPDIVVVKNKKAFLHHFRSKAEKRIATQRSKIGWFVNDSSVDLRKKPFNHLLESDKIALFSGEDKSSHLADLVRDTVLDNISIFQWSYKEQDFLPEHVPISEFIASPDKYKTVANMFRIAGWKRNQFATSLQNQTDSVYDNLLSQVEREINSLIKNHWSTHTKLGIKLQHKHTYLTVHLHEPGSTTPPEYRSDGLKWFLTFLINFRAHSKTISNYILLIDEPGLHLHPRGQKDTLQELENLCRKNHNQVVYTTHQTFLINKNAPERVRIIERKLDKKGTQARLPFYASKVSEVTNPKSILTDKLLREALGFKVSDISPINEKNILVEGVLDREIFHIISSHWQIIDFNECSIISCNGATEIAKHASLYVANELVVVCFYDSDSSAKSACERNTRIPNAKKRQIRDCIDKPGYETMEDLIPQATFEVAYKKWAAKWQINESHPNRPRMQGLQHQLQAERKTEMKHSLEEIIVETVRKDLKTQENDFLELKKIVEDLNTRLR